MLPKASTVSEDYLISPDMVEYKPASLSQNPKSGFGNQRIQQVAATLSHSAVQFHIITKLLSGFHQDTVTWWSRDYAKIAPKCCWRKARSLMSDDANSSRKWDNDAKHFSPTARINDFWFYRTWSHGRDSFILLQPTFLAIWHTLPSMVCLVYANNFLFLILSTCRVDTIPRCLTCSANFILLNLLTLRAENIFLGC